MYRNNNIDEIEPYGHGNKLVQFMAVWKLDLIMSDPYDMPTCSTCGDVVGFCSCIEKVQDERNRKLRDGKQCPKCHDEESIVEIAYGYPGQEMIEKYEKGEIKLGGCLVSEDNPDWHCNKCEHEWSGRTYGRML